MVTTKEKPDLSIIRLGTHLFRIDRKDGTSFLKWDWDVLEKEIIEATKLTTPTKPKKKTKK